MTNTSLNTHVKINSLNSVGLTGSGLAGDDVYQCGDELDGQLDDGGGQAALFLGCRAQLGVVIINIVTNGIYRGRTKLPTKFLSAVPGIFT